MRNTPRFIGTALFAGALLALTGCASAEPKPAPSTGVFNDADVVFVQMMIPHHEQAVEMSEIILDAEGIDPAVTELATAITAAQGPEIEKMEGWLDAWGAEDADDVGMKGMDHGADGMMSKDDLSKLEDATGVAAERLFLDGMTIHHEGAVAMAELEITIGQNVDAKALAEAISESQTEEIDLMKEIRAGL